MPICTDILHMCVCMYIYTTYVHTYICAHTYTYAHKHTNAVGTHADRIVKVQGSKEALIAVRSGGLSARSRECAEKTLANIGRTRAFEKRW